MNITISDAKFLCALRIAVDDPIVTDLAEQSAQDQEEPFDISIEKAMEILEQETRGEIVTVEDYKEAFDDLESEYQELARRLQSYRRVASALDVENKEHVKTIGTLCRQRDAAQAECILAVEDFSKANVAMRRNFRRVLIVSAVFQLALIAALAWAVCR